MHVYLLLDEDWFLGLSHRRAVTFFFFFRTTHNFFVSRFNIILRISVLLADPKTFLSLTQLHLRHLYTNDCLPVTPFSDC